MLALLISKYGAFGIKPARTSAHPLTLSMYERQNRGANTCYAHYMNVRDVRVRAVNFFAFILHSAHSEREPGRLSTRFLAARTSAAAHESEYYIYEE